jgi:hypothetical protein
MEKRKPRTPAVLREEQRKQRLEAAALAAYQMEQGTYHYPEGAYRGRKKPDGTRDWNKQEILRVYGHKHYGHPDIVFEDEHFKRSLEYQRWRGSDPLFRKKVQGRIWAEIADELSLRIYEQVKFRPLELSYEQVLKTMKLILDAGLKFSSEKSKDIAGELLGDIDPKAREALLEEQEKEYKRKADQTRSLRRAYQAGDVIEGELSE